ncbi:hypothetical protein ACFX13_047249 [Malus domestica]
MEVGCLDFWETGFLQALFNLYSELLRWVLVLHAAESAASREPIEVQKFPGNLGFMRLRAEFEFFAPLIQCFFFMFSC